MRLASEQGANEALSPLRTQAESHFKMVKSRELTGPARNGLELFLGGALDRGEKNSLAVSLTA